MTSLSKTALVLQELLRHADAAEGNNRWQFKPLSAPPTITGSTTAPSSTVYTRYHSADITGAMPWQVLGGKLLRQPVEGETWGKRIVTGIIELANTDYPSDLWTGRSGCIAVQFLGDEIIFELEANNPSYQFLIEEDGVDRVMNADGLGITTVGTSNQDKAYYKLSWSTVKMRKITLQCNANEALAVGMSGTANFNRIGRFGGIYTKEHDIITRPRYHGPRIGGMGDSNIQGTNGPSSEGYLSVAFNELGLKDCWISSYGASGAYAASPGYYDAGTGKTSRNGVKWSQRRQVWQDGNLDIMVFSISWNDWNLVNEDTTVALEMIELDACRALHPDMPIVMIGLHTMPIEESADDTSPSGTTILGTNAKMKAAIESRDDPLMRFLDTSKLYDTPFSGSNSDYHAGIGDYDINFGAWGHYSRQGDRRIGRAISARLYDIFRDMYYDQTTLSEPATPYLSSTSGSQSYTVAVAKSVDLATVANGVLGTIASVTPALPSGVAASVTGSGTKLTVAGTASAAVASTSYVIVVNVVGGGTLSYTLSLTVAAAASPALVGTATTQETILNVALSVDVATATNCTLSSIVGVNPALPSGLSLSVGSSGTKLHLAGTPDTASSAWSGSHYYDIEANIVGGGTVTYRLSLLLWESAPTAPSLSATSGSQSATVGVAKSVDLATAVSCNLTSIASVTPALPAGLLAGVSSNKVRLSGTGTVAAASGSYVIVVNVEGGGTLTFTLTLVVVAASTSEYLIDVTFNGLSTDTSLTDAAGNVWVPVGGATLNGVVPEGGGFECTSSALLAGAVFGTGDFTIEAVMSPTGNDITLIDFGVALGNPMACCVDGAGTALVSFYSTSAGWKQAATNPTGAGSWKKTNSNVSFYRDSGVIKLGFDWMADLSWGGGADTHDYATAPTKVTIGTRQGDATNRPFVGTMTSLKVRKGS